ncbi:MAG TPA: hypothetical protein DCE81_06930 [Cytophagales bacterium]|jgi:hypothetical protein|nr:hypothetical protein [Cytophagales bacterium]
MKDTFRKACYTYLKFLGGRLHLLKNSQTGKTEVFMSNKNHASWGLVYKNTHLEFVSSTSGATR